MITHSLLEYTIDFGSLPAANSARVLCSGKAKPTAALRCACRRSAGTRVPIYMYSAVSGVSDMVAPTVCPAAARSALANSIVQCRRCKDVSRCCMLHVRLYVACTVVTQGSLR